MAGVAGVRDGVGVGLGGGVTMTPLPDGVGVGVELGGGVTMTPDPLPLVRFNVKRAVSPALTDMLIVTSKV